MLNQRNIMVGILALQGAFLEHAKLLADIGVDSIFIRQPADLKKIDALIIPGGESTAMAKLLTDFNLRAPIVKLIDRGLPVWGVCAGLILLAIQVLEGEPEPLKIINIKVARNAYGSQVDSFKEAIYINALGPKPFPGIFIRAPKIIKAGKGVKVLAKIGRNNAVAVQENNTFATAFHPELTSDTRFHEFFVQFIISSGLKKRQI